MRHESMDLGRSVVDSNQHINITLTYGSHGFSFDTIHHLYQDKTRKNKLWQKILWRKGKNYFMT